ncbi:MAG: glycosyltransferase family 2 protein [Bacteroidaceae bacterium]|nr:glycosyltransferase family 2 protein [Bacteroidaceae bacterium]
MIDISFITVNFNGLKDTLELIESLANTVKSISYEVIVVDNASQNQEALSTLFNMPKVKFIPSTENLGFAGGNNLGIQAASGKYLFFINNDTFIKEDHFDEFIKAYGPKTGLLCPKLCFSVAPHNVQYAGFTDLSSITLRNQAIGYGAPDLGQYDKPAKTFFAHGASMMVSKEHLEKVGVMCEDYFLYYEEMDWSIRFRNAGYSIEYNPVQTIYHKESQSTGQSSPLKIYYLTRNRLKYASKFQKGIFKLMSLCYLIFVVGARDYSKYTAERRPDLRGAMLQGIRHFLTGKFGKQT